MILFIFFILAMVTGVSGLLMNEESDLKQIQLNKYYG